MKREKCFFAQHEVPLFGHILGGRKIKMDRGKIQVIVDWEPSTKVTKLRSFIGLVNYYKSFIKGYSTITSPLTNMLNKRKVWEWSLVCQEAFDRLKRAITDKLVLALPDHTKPYEVHTNALDFAIGRVLMQDGHPIALKIESSMRQKKDTRSKRKK